MTKEDAMFMERLTLLRAEFELFAMNRADVNSNHIPDFIVWLILNQNKKQ